MSNWISVDDELPKGKVLICYLGQMFGATTKEVGIGYYDNPDDYEDNGGEGWLFWLNDRKVLGGGVTHWQPLPDTP